MHPAKYKSKASVHLIFIFISLHTSQFTFNLNIRACFCTKLPEINPELKLKAMITRWDKDSVLCGKHVRL